MRRLLVCLLLVTGCSALPVARQGETVGDAAPMLRRIHIDHFADLRRDVDRYLAARPGRAAVQVTDLSDGQTFGHHADEAYVMASVAKIDILVARLLTGVRLSPVERRLTGRMIRFSDNKAADALFRTVGDGAGLTAVNRRLRLTCTLAYEGNWGGSTTCPGDQVRLLRVLATGGTVLPLSRAYALDLMTTVAPAQRWGVSAAALPGDRVALKNGWTPLKYQGSGWAVNSVGRITGHGHDFLIAVLTSEQPSMSAGIATVEHLARLTTGAFRAA
ncbi:serine hydrolase [Actinocorallia lasiicapitis]